MKYIKMGWPEIQDYMMKEDYNENVYFDPRKNCWFIPDTWEPDECYKNQNLELKNISNYMIVTMQ